MKILCQDGQLHDERASSIHKISTDNKLWGKKVIIHAHPTLAINAFQNLIHKAATIMIAPLDACPKFISEIERKVAPDFVIVDHDDRRKKWHTTS